VISLSELNKKKHPMAHLYLHNDPAYSTFKVQQSDAVSWKTPVIGPAIHRTKKILRAQDNFYSAKSNRTIRINLPREDMGVEECFLKMAVVVGATLPGTPGDYVRLANHSSSLVEEVRLRIGSFEHSIRNYNIMSNLFADIEIPHTVKETQMFDNYGYGPDFYRSAMSAGGQRQNLIIPIKWLGADKGILPLDAIYQLGGPVDQYLEIVIAEPTTCVETNGMDADIKIDQIEMHYDQITSVNNAFRDYTVAEIRSRNGSFSFPTVKLYQTPIVSSVTDCNIPHKENNLQSMTTVLTDMSSRNDMTVSNKFGNYPKDFGAGCVVRSYHTDLGGVLVPLERVDASDQAQHSYMDYCLSFGFASNTMKEVKHPAPISLLQFNGVTGNGKFFMHTDLHTLKTNLSKGVDAEYVVNPLNLRNETRSIIFKLDLTNAPPPAVNLVAYHICRYNQIVRVDPGSGHLVKHLL